MLASYICFNYFQVSTEVCVSIGNVESPVCLRWCAGPGDLDHSACLLQCAVWGALDHSACLLQCACVGCSRSECLSATVCLCGVL